MAIASTGLRPALGAVGESASRAYRFNVSGVRADEHGMPSMSLFGHRGLVSRSAACCAAAVPIHYRAMRLVSASRHVYHASVPGRIGSQWRLTVMLGIGDRRRPTAPARRQPKVRGWCAAGLLCHQDLTNLWRRMCSLPSAYRET